MYRFVFFFFFLNGAAEQAVIITQTRYLWIKYMVKMLINIVNLRSSRHKAKITYWHSVQFVFLLCQLKSADLCWLKKIFVVNIWLSFLVLTLKLTKVLCHLSFLHILLEKGELSYWNVHKHTQKYSTKGKSRVWTILTRLSCQHLVQSSLFFSFKLKLSSLAAFFVISFSSFRNSS